MTTLTSGGPGLWKEAGLSVRTHKTYERKTVCMPKILLLDYKVVVMVLLVVLRSRM